jgi:hypothetical protein
MKQPEPVSVAFDEAGMGFSSESRRREWIWLATFSVVALLLPLVYVAVTHHEWEDWFITFRYSKNLVDGKGLVFNPGERVHGFTSAINVMLPAFFYWITGKTGYAAALNFYRAVSLIAYVLGGLVTLRLMCRHRGTDRFSTLLFLFLYTTEAKTVAFTMNGQECGFMVGFLSIAFAASYSGVARFWWVAGLAWAGLLYTRPDSPVYIAAVASGGLLFRKETLRQTFVGLMKAGAMATILYLPWFVSMWVYYGCPVPHTVIAKSKKALYDLTGLHTDILRNYPAVVGLVFAPAYIQLGGWPQWIQAYASLCGVMCTLYWVIPSRDRLGRMASLIFMFAALYLTLIAGQGFPYPWYFPSAMVFGSIVLSRLALGLSRGFGSINRWSVLAARIVQVAVASIALLLFGETVWQIRIQQHEIEDNHRKQVGLYLHEMMKPNEKAYMEPLGYIGYFSDRYIDDWPGLVYPRVVQLRRRWKTVDQVTIIPQLMPDWIVLRPPELSRAASLPQLLDRYKIVKVFDARTKLREYPYIPGRGYLEFDAVLIVLHRKDAPAMTL